MAENLGLGALFRGAALRSGAPALTTGRPAIRGLASEVRPGLKTRSGLEASAPARFEVGRGLREGFSVPRSLLPPAVRGFLEGLAGLESSAGRAVRGLREGFSAPRSLLPPAARGFLEGLAGLESSVLGRAVRGLREGAAATRAAPRPSGAGPLWGFSVLRVPSARLGAGRVGLAIFTPLASPDANRRFSHNSQEISCDVLLSPASWPGAASEGKNPRWPWLLRLREGFHFRYAWGFSFFEESL